MLLYTHPVNDERTAKAQRSINSFWVSGSGALNEPATANMQVNLTRILAQAAFALGCGRELWHFVRMPRLFRYPDLPQGRVLARHLQHHQVQPDPGGADGVVVAGDRAGAQPQDHRAWFLARRVLLPGAAVAGGGGVDLEMAAAKPGCVQRRPGGCRRGPGGLAHRRKLGLLLDHLCIDLGPHGVFTR